MYRSASVYQIPFRFWGIAESWITFDAFVMRPRRERDHEYHV